MAGLEPLVALGLACNILQLAGTAGKAIALVRQCYKDGALDPTLTNHANDLKKLADHVQDTCNQAATGTTANIPGNTSRDDQLVDLATKCIKATHDLQQEVASINSTTGKTKSLRALRMSFKAFTRKGRLDDLSRTMTQAERILASGLLANIFERSVQANADLSSLRSNVQAFIDAYPQNSRREIDDLVQHMAIELKRSETIITDHVDGAITKLDQAADRRLDVLLKNQASDKDNSRQAAEKARLLGSLNFEDMNERFNQIVNSLEKTSQWVLRDSDESEDDSDESEDDESIEGNDMTKREWHSFPDWLASRATVYWVSGKPGSGKSTLMKYLRGNINTQRYLNDWSPGTLIISHFLFRPGNKLQHSVKGLLLSLLHQLIDEDDTMLGTAYELIPNLTRKSHNTDWSEGELKELLFEILGHGAQSIAIFIDGLDEVFPESNLTPLLNSIGRLEEVASSTEKLKLCLSSRPEPLLVRKLGRHPRLQLEQLNRADLRRYAEATILIPPDYRIFLDDPIWIGRSRFHKEHLPSVKQLAAYLVEMLVDRADGIFLWLYLTADTVCKALQLGESVADLKHRINHMPRELSDLFKDMWERTNGDSKEQKFRAGFYVRLIFNIASSTHDSIFSMEEDLLTQFHIALMSNQKLLDILLDANSPELVPVGDLLRACQYIEKDIPIRCAGLVHRLVSRDSSGRETLHCVSRPRYGSEYIPLQQYLIESPSYAFIHRSARDFLCETDTGQSILRINDASIEETYLLLLKADLVHSCLFRRFAERSRGWYKLMHQTSLDWQLRRIEKVGASDMIESSCLRMVRLCEKFFTRGVLLGTSNIPWSERAARKALMYKKHVLFDADETTVHGEAAFALEAAFISSNSYTWKHILSRIEDRPLRIETISEILSYACAHKPLWEEGWHNLRYDAVQSLLSKGANARVAISSRHRFSYTKYIYIRRTPLATLLITAWEQAVVLDGLSDLVQLLVDHGADLEEHVHFSVRHTRGSVWFRILSIFEDMDMMQDDGTIDLVFVSPAWAILTILLDKHHPESSDAVHGSALNAYVGLDAYDQARLFAVGQRDYTDGSYERPRKTGIYLQHHWGDFAHHMEHFARLIIEALRAWSQQSRRTYRPWFSGCEVMLPEELRSSVDQALRILRVSGSLEARTLGELRVKLGIETPLEEFMPRHDLDDCRKWLSADSEVSDDVEVLEWVFGHE